MESQNHSDNATVISRLLSYNSQLDSFGRAAIQVVKIIQLGHIQMTFTSYEKLVKK